MKKVVGVEVDGVLTWHAVGVGPTDHDTLCGIDANDPAIGHTGSVEARRGQKIDCRQCKFIWKNLRELNLRKSDFAE